MLPSLVACACAVMLALAMGCGGSSQSAIKGHSYAAQTLDDLASGARQSVLELRQTALLEAGKDAEKAGQPVTPAVLAAADAFDRGPILHGVNAFIGAKEAYVRVVLVAAQASEPDWVGLKLALQSALRSYEDLRKAVGERLALPEVPKAVVAVLTSRVETRRPRDALALRSMLFVEAWI
jgi:hypothetical protein